MTAILARLPRWAQIIPVFGVILIIIYTWTLIWFFWEVPSWLYYLRIGEVLVLLAYTLATNFAESLLVLCGPLLLALALPPKWFRDVFVARGAALSIAGLGCLIFLARQFTDKDAYPGFWLRLPILLAAAVGLAALVYLCGRVRLLRTAVEAVAERVSIFAYILAPLSVISVLVVGLRLLIG